MRKYTIIFLFFLVSCSYINEKLAEDVVEDVVKDVAKDEIAPGLAPEKK